MSDPRPELPVRTGAMPMGSRGIELRTYEDAYRFAKTVIESGFAPKGMSTPAQVLIALQTGAEAGLTPMQALSSVVVINGRASWMGDAAKAIVRRAGLLEPGTDFDTALDGEGDALRAVATAHRRGMRMPVSYSFGVADAKRAGLWGKAGPWTQHPKRMLKYRAEGFLLRDHFSDALMGLYTDVEAIDIPAEHAIRTPPVADPLLAGATAPSEPSFIDAEYREPVEPEPENPVGGETEKTPEQGAVTATEEPRETPVLSSAAPAPAVDRLPEEWTERGVCVDCGRHRSLIEQRRTQGLPAHGRMKDNAPCPRRGSDQS